MLASYPYVIVGAVSLLGVTCLIVILTMGALPDFTDPKLVSLSQFGTLEELGGQLIICVLDE